MRILYCARMLAAALLLTLSVQPAAASDKDFKMIVKNIESSYNARRKSIPFLGFAGLFVKIARPAGVKDIKLAIFEDQDFSSGPGGLEFQKAIESSFKEKWQPVVRSSLRAEGSRAYIYTQPAGKDMEVLSITFARRQAIVVQAKLDPESLMKFLEKPEIMGISLAGSFNTGGLLAGRASSIAGGPASSDDSGDSISSLGGASVDQLATRENRPKPVLRVRSNEEAEPDPGPAPAEKVVIEKDVIRLEARLVNLNVKVTDRSGNPLQDLEKEDFVILEDGIEQDIAYFEPVTAPISLVLLLDLSGSTKDVRKSMIKAAKKFIDSLNKDDRVAIAAFTREFTLLSDFTTDRKLLKKRVEGIKKIRGGTAYYDSMWTALDLLARVSDARKAIVVLTDGQDNSIQRYGYAPTEHTFEELLMRASEEEATIYPIYFNTDEWKPRFRDRDSVESEIIARRYEEYTRPARVARKQMEMLAERTAGVVIDAENEDNLDAAYERVASELRTLYSLGYSPKDLRKNGRFRKIEVRVNREGTTARTRRGYYAR
ncbi:MAG TPA: VWA domain-containing protein [Blastocatellia bacterium]|nr:VWA domain-containing protein [Blastocatellia bacterium]